VNRWARLRAALAYALLLVFTLLFVAAVLFMLVGSLKPDDLVLAEAGTLRAFFPDTISLDNYRAVFERVPFGLYLASSLIINGLIVGLGLLVNAFAGYALARLRWWGREAMLALVLAVLVIPFEAIAIHRDPRTGPHGARRRADGAARALGLRQVHAAAPARGRSLCRDPARVVQRRRTPGLGSRTARPGADPGFGGVGGGAGPRTHSVPSGLETNRRAHRRP
jgi:hypothetical protein